MIGFNSQIIISCTLLRLNKFNSKLQHYSSPTLQTLLFSKPYQEDAENG